MSENGDSQQRKPAVVIYFDGATQTVQLGFDNQQVKNLDFLLSVLGMATRGMEAQLRIQQAMATQQQAIEQEAQQRVLRQVLTTKH